MSQMITTIKKGLLDPEHRQIENKWVERQTDIVNSEILSEWDRRVSEKTFKEPDGETESKRLRMEKGGGQRESMSSVRMCSKRKISQINYSPP